MARNFGDCVLEEHVAQDDLVGAASLRHWAIDGISWSIEVINVEFDIPRRTTFHERGGTGASSRSTAQ